MNLSIQRLIPIALGVVIFLIASSVAYLAWSIGHDHDASLVTLQLVILGLFQGGTLVLVTAFLHSASVQPLNRIKDRLERIGHGVFNERVPAEGVREVAQVATAYNRAAEGLAEREHRLLHEHRIQSIRLLLEGVAHEVNNPLTYMRINEQVIASKGRALDDEKLRHLSQRNLAGLDRLSELTATLLEISRDQPGQRRLHRIDTLARGSLILAQSRLIARDFEIEIESTSQVLANATDVTYCLVLLLTQAGDATQMHGRIKFTARDTAAGVAFEVADDGIRIIPALRDHVFSSFSPRLPGRPGLGVVKQIVEAHGGHVHVEEAEAWTRFRITLPLEAS